MGTLLELLGGGALGAVLLAVVGWLLGRRKARAELSESEATTAEKLTDIAMGLVGPLEKELGRVRGDLETTAGKLADHIEGDLEGKRRRAKAYLEHQEWDEELATLARNAGIPISDPPPLHEEG